MKWNEIKYYVKQRMSSAHCTFVVSGKQMHDGFCKVDWLEHWC